MPEWSKGSHCQLFGWIIDYFEFLPISSHLSNLPNCTLRGCLWRDRYYKCKKFVYIAKLWEFDPKQPFFALLHSIEPSDINISVFLILEQLKFGIHLRKSSEVEAIF